MTLCARVVLEGEKDTDRMKRYIRASDSDTKGHIDWSRICVCVFKRET